MNEPTQKYIVTKYACSGQVEIYELHEVDGGKYLSGQKGWHTLFVSKRAGVCCKTRTEAVASIEKAFYKRRRSLEKSLAQLDVKREEMIRSVQLMKEIPE
jgi:hypothetical protein